MSCGAISSLAPCNINTIASRVWYKSALWFCFALFYQPQMINQWSSVCNLHSVIMCVCNCTISSGIFSQNPTIRPYLTMFDIRVGPLNLRSQNFSLIHRASTYQETIMEHIKTLGGRRITLAKESFVY